MNPLTTVSAAALLHPLASALRNAGTSGRTVACTHAEPRNTNSERVPNSAKSDQKLFHILADARADGRAAARPMRGVKNAKTGGALSLGRLSSEPLVVASVGRFHHCAESHVATDSTVHVLVQRGIPRHQLWPTARRPTSVDCACVQALIGLIQRS